MIPAVAVAPDAPRPHRLWLAAALVVFALVSLSVGVIAKHNTLAPGLYPPSYLKLFFSDPIHLKVWLATAAVVLACFQVVTAAHIYERLRLPVGAAVGTVHRWSGRLAILLTLPVAYHCIFLLGYGDYSTRVQVHSLLGSVIYGAFIAKVLIVRGGVALPRLGASPRRRHALRDHARAVAHFEPVVLPERRGGHLSRLAEALAWAIDAHGEQRRKGTDVPYHAHLLGVASLVLSDGGSEDEAVAAVLHDLVEDTDATVDDVRDRFGERVARIVDACTDAHERPKPEWGERKRAYIERMRTAQPDELRVSLADKLYNASSIEWDLRLRGDDLWRVFGSGRDGQIWYYRSLADIFLERAPGPMADELDRVLRRIEEDGA